MTTFLLEVDDETWKSWKLTVPRDKTLNDRLIELLEADADGRVMDERQTPRNPEPVEDPVPKPEPNPEPNPEPSENTVARIDDLDWSVVEAAHTDEREQVLAVACEYLRERGEATKSDFLEDVYPDHDVRLSPESWWKFVSGLLGQLDEIQASRMGQAKWRYVG